jgi:hypothetical protein
MKYLLRSLSIVAFILLSLLGSAQAQRTASIAFYPYLGEIFPISQLNNLKWSPAVAYSPQHHEYLVVWENDWGGNHDIYGQRVSEQGELLSWFAISAGEHDRIEPAVAYDPVNDRYLIVWAFDYLGDGSDFDIRARFIAWDGSSMTEEIVISNTENMEIHPQVAYGLAPEAFTIVWSGDNATISTYIAGRQIAADSGDLGSIFILSADEYDSTYPDIAYNQARNEWLIVWMQYVFSDWDIYGIRLSGNGIPQGSGAFAIHNTLSDETAPSVAACDLLDQYLVVYGIIYVTTFDDYNLQMRYVSGDGVPGSTHEVGATPNAQLNPDVACSSGGNGYMFVWQDENPGYGYAIYGQEAGEAGFTRPVYTIVPPGTSVNRTYPAIGSGSSQFLVTWVHDIWRGDTASKNIPSFYQDIYGRIYTPYVVFLPLLKN